MLFSITACSKKDKIAEYSVGLDENGYYLNLDKYNFDVPDFNDATVSIDDVIKFSMETLKDNGYDIENEEEYLNAYIVSYLETLNVNNKEVVEDTDIVTISFSFYDSDGNLMQDYVQDNMTIGAKKENGDPIEESVIGHKVGDKYEIEYKFEDDDKYNPGKTANVKIEVKAISYSDPIAAGLVEENIEEIQKEFPDVTDAKSLREAIRPYVAQYNLTAYIETLLLSVSIKVPDEYTNYEFQRFLNRINQLGYTYEQYLKESEMTDLEVKNTCSRAAAENVISMLIFKNEGIEITQEVMDEKYGTDEEDYDYYVSMQGEPYMKLRIIRATALDIIASQVKLVDVDGNPVNLDPQEELLPTEIQPIESDTQQKEVSEK